MEGRVEDFAGCLFLRIAPDELDSVVDKFCFYWNAAPGIGRIHGPGLVECEKRQFRKSCISTVRRLELFLNNEKLSESNFTKFTS